MEKEIKDWDDELDSMEDYEFVDLDGIYEYYKSADGKIRRKFMEFECYEELEEWYYRN